MNKINLPIVFSMFIFATLGSFGGANYLLSDHLPYAALPIGFYFVSGLWLPHVKDEKMHAAWLGLSVGLGGAVLKSLPSAFASH